MRIKKKHLECRRRFIEFGLVDGELPFELYVDIIKKEFKLSTEKAERLVENILEMGEILEKKKKEGLEERLLK